MARLLKLKGGELALAATCLAILFTFGVTAWPQSPPIKIILTGQSMIRSDIRLYTPSIVSTMAPLLKGDVVFTNFEATVAEKGQPNETAPREGNSLAPPEAMDALMDLGFNMLALANNHSWDLRVPGIQNAIQEANRRSLAHAGTGNTLEESYCTRFPAHTQTHLLHHAGGSYPFSIDYDFENGLVTHFFSSGAELGMSSA